MIFDRKLVVLDVETQNHSSDDEPRIIEIAAFKLDTTLEVIDTFHKKVKIDELLTDFTKDLTGLVDEEAEIVWSELCNPFAEFCEYNECRIGSWSAYDITVLRQEYKRNGHEYPLNGSNLDIKSIAIFWANWMGYRFKDYELGTIMKALDIEQVFAHRANYDAKYTIDVLKRMADSFK